jgi:DAACS family dicarboxylate/amino acid:cation (Na+ or H+) symporter
MCLGGIAGVLLGQDAVPLGVFGKLFVQLIKMLAIPLVFFSILEALVATSISWKSAGKLFIVVAINSTCALLIGLSLSNLIEPGRGFVFQARPGDLPPSGIKEFDLQTALNAIVPSSILQPFVENNVISVVLLALLIGGALRRHLYTPKANYAVGQFEKFIGTVLAVWGIVLDWLVRLVPIAVLCVTARTVGEYGFAPFKGLAWYTGLAICGLAIHVTLVYPIWIRLVAGVPLWSFWMHARRPIVYAFGTNSSLATLPLTLTALDELRVPKSASRLGACIGTNLNNDGIILYEAMAVLFVAQAYGIDLSITQQVTAALLSLAAAIGVAGIPEAGVISLSLVLTAVGLPLEILPMLLTVDWIIARARSITNVLSDMTVSIGIASLEKQEILPVNKVR